MTKLLDRTWKLWVPLSFVIFMVAGFTSAVSIGEGQWLQALFFGLISFPLLAATTYWLCMKAAQEVDEGKARVEGLLIAYGVDPARAPQLREALQTEMSGLTTRR